MPTRSGKKYLIPHKCHGCDFDYYSHKNFDYKCSSCWEYCEKNGIMSSKEFGDKCRQWAKDNIVDEYGVYSARKMRSIPYEDMETIYKIYSRITEKKEPGDSVGSLGSICK